MHANESGWFLWRFGSWPYTHRESDLFYKRRSRCHHCTQFLNADYQMNQTNCDDSKKTGEKPGRRSDKSEFVLTFFGVYAIAWDWYSWLSDCRHRTTAPVTHHALNDAVKYKFYVPHEPGSSAKLANENATMIHFGINKCEESSRILLLSDTIHCFILVKLSLFEANFGIRVFCSIPFSSPPFTTSNISAWAAGIGGEIKRRVVARRAQIKIVECRL